VRRAGAPSVPISVAVAMNRPVSTEDLARACRSTSSILVAVTEADLAKPTPCAEWDVRALLEHVIGSADFFADVAELGACPDDKIWPTYPDEDLPFAFSEHAERLEAAFAAPGAMDMPMTLPIGEVPGATCLAVATGEIFIHGWDVAKATGQRTGLDPIVATSLLESVWIELCDKVRVGDDPVFGPPQAAASDTPLSDQLAAYLGRAL
jgi:uncharacterized protein (TIGR03086 family)